MAAKSLTTSEPREPATSISIFQSIYAPILHCCWASPVRQAYNDVSATFWCLESAVSRLEVDGWCFRKGSSYGKKRYSSRNWSGTGSDMSIEESVMRETKTSGGIRHGAQCCEDALGSWFLFIEHASKVSEDYAGSIRRQLTHLATSILIQLSPPRPEIF